VTTHKITLPGPPVSAEVSWDMVRAYLTREGWNPTSPSADEDGEEYWRARDNRGASCFIGGADDPAAIEVAINRLARLASCSPGEMLARIASPPCEDCDRPGNMRRHAYEVCPKRPRIVGQPSPSFYGANPIPIPSTDLSPPPDLWAQVRALLGHTAIQVTADYRDATSATPRYVVTWRSGSGEYRQEERASEVECLRLVLEIEGAPLCVPGCVRRETEGAGHPGACREKP